MRLRTALTWTAATAIGTTLILAACMPRLAPAAAIDAAITLLRIAVKLAECGVARFPLI